MGKIEKSYQASSSTEPAEHETASSLADSYLTALLPPRLPNRPNPHLDSASAQHSLPFLLLALARLRQAPYSSVPAYRKSQHVTLAPLSQATNQDRCRLCICLLGPFWRLMASVSVLRAICCVGVGARWNEALLADASSCRGRGVGGRRLRACGEWLSDGLLMVERKGRIEDLVKGWRAEWRGGWIRRCLDWRC